MTDKKKRESKELEQDKKKNQKSEDPLPYCTTASDPEHARGYQEDEPCDDARSGKVESTEEQLEATEEKVSTANPKDD